MMGPDVADVNMQEGANARTEGASYHHGDLRRALIQHGLALLEDAEEASLSLRELARMAKVSPGAVYRHFANKEDLLVALAVEGFERLTHAQAQAYLDARQQAVSASSALSAGGIAYVRFARGQPALFRLMFGRFAAAHGNALLLQASKQNSDLLMMSIRKILSDSVDDADVRAICVATWAMIHGLSSLILDQQLTEQGPELDALVDKIIRTASEWAPRIGASQAFGMGVGA